MSISERNQTGTDLEIRPFTSQDYEALVEIANAIFPDAPTTVAAVRFEDDHWDSAKYLHQRYVACERSIGRVIGIAGLQHIPWNFHPQKFGVNVRVHPGWRRRGIGTRLWEQLVEVLREHQGVLARTVIRENMADGVYFATRYGFKEVMRAWESRLDVAACDLTQFRAQVDRAAGSGMTITTVAAEYDRDPDCLQRLYAIHSAIGKDVPAPDRFTPPDFRLFVTHWFDSPNALHDAHFIAVADGEYIGVSVLSKPQLGDWLVQQLTGVRREYRGRGIATALKVRTVEFAKARGDP